MDLANTFVERPGRPATLDEAEQVIDTLWRLLQACREQLELNSSNSSLPPSQDRLSGKAKDRHRRKPSGKSRGAQAGHIAHTRDLVPEAEVDRIERHNPKLAANAAVRSASIRLHSLDIRSSICPRSPIPSPNISALAAPASAASAASPPGFPKTFPPARWAPA